jgi:capsular polysaccharide transport system permease protein
MRLRKMILGNSALHSLIVQLRVIGALVLRDAHSKYGHENLGFLWIVVEPLMLSSMVMIMWAVTNHGHMEHIGLVLFVLTGYCGMTMWRHVIGGSTQMVRKKSGLLFHMNVKPIDIIISTCLLEIIGIFAAFTCAYIPLVVFEVIHPPNDLLLIVTGWVLLGWVAISFALLIAGLSEIFEPVEKFVTPVMYVTIPLTGVFSMTDWLPYKAQIVLQYSPIASAMEMFRAGAFPPDINTFYDAQYIVMVCLILTAVGIPLMAYAQRHVTHN